MASVIGLVRRIYTVVYPPNVSKEPNPLRFGILGAAAIAPAALINPAKSHPDVIIYGVAARDKERAEVFAKKNGITKAYGGPTGYQELLDDPEIDAIYNPLPNGLHFEWTMKALAAGKHVLLEKPSADTAEETRIMFEYAESKGLILLEAFHYRFHPAIQRVKAILDSGELGPIKSIEATLGTPKGFMKEDDIRYDMSLGGGGMMDMGCYTMNCIRYLASANPTAVLDASAIKHNASPDVDEGTTAAFSFPNSVTASLMCNLGLPWKIVPSMPQVKAIVMCEGGEVELFNFVLPTLYHNIRVTVNKNIGEKKKRVEKVYKFVGDEKGEAWWTTYRFQLEAFVDKLRGRTPQTWITKEDSVDNMHWIEEVYAKSGLGSRPKSNFVLS